MSSIEGTAREEWRRHWTVVLAAAFGVGLSATHSYSTGPFIAPLQAEFGWARAQISSGMAVATFTAAILAPFMGVVIDKVGPRRVALPGGILYCGVTALLAWATSDIWLWWAMWFLVGLGGLCIKPTVWTVSVASLFQKGRGLALAVTLCGTGIGSALMPMIATWLIDHHGWRSAYLMMAAILFAVTFPMFYFLLDSAADRKRLKPDQISADAPAPVGVTAREAFTSLRFAKLAIAACLFTVGVMGIVANLVPILTSMELSRAQAAGIAGLGGLTSVIGRLCTGYLLDRFDGNIVGGVAVLLPTISCALLLLAPGSVEATIVAVVLIGLSLGAELDVIAYLTTRHFGTWRYGTIFGTITAVWSLAVGIGPTVANFVYDKTGSYQPAIMGFLPLFAVSALALLTLGAFPTFPDRPAEDADAAREPEPLPV